MSKITLADKLKELEVNNLQGLFSLFIEELGYEYIDDRNQEIYVGNWEISSEITESIVDIRTIAKYKKFQIIYCQLDSLKKIREHKIGKKLLDFYNYILVIFTDKNFTQWHFVNIRWNEEKEKRNLFRRLVIDDFSRIYTAVERLSLISINEISDSITEPELMHIHDEAFDVEAVTKEFFESYKKILIELREYFLKQKKASPIQCHEAAQQFMNRMMLLYFIQKKGWLIGSKNYIYDLFLYYRKKIGKNHFYDSFLTPLFFNALCNNHNYSNYSIPSKIEIEYNQMPYLNGGLFEQTEVDNLGLLIEDKFIMNLFENLLEKYNFTISENSPLDQEIAIDPEMLGKVYESLIFEEERGQRGIFYTPRNEIYFICRQSIYHFLKTKIDIDIQNLTDFIFSEGNPINFGNKTCLEALYYLTNIKIVDPACGSGSFLVEMVLMLYNMLHSLHIFLGKTFEKIDVLKKIIFNSIYGVDIKKWAVKVAELRIWLNLIVEMDNKDIKKDEAILPNFSLKLRNGDSILPSINGVYIKIPIGFVMKEKIDQDIDAKIKNLLEKKKIFFFHFETGGTSILEKEIKKLEMEIFSSLLNKKKESLELQLKRIHSSQLTLDTFDSGKKIVKEDKKSKLKKSNLMAQIDEINLVLNEIENFDYENERILSNTFIWDLDFIEVFFEGGFDIVIGNPPYIRHRDIVSPKGNTTTLNNQYREDIFDFTQDIYDNTLKLDKVSDFYIYFYYSNLKIIKKKGIHTFIVSNSWLDVRFGFLFQEFLCKNIQILQFIDSSKRSFQQAEINTIISILQIPEEERPNYEKMTDFVYLKNGFDDIFIRSNVIAINNRKKIDDIQIRSIPQSKLFSYGVQHTSKKQTELERNSLIGNYIGSRWGNLFFRAPDSFFRLLDNYGKSLIKIRDIGNIERGFSTSCNDFFILEDLGNDMYQNGYGHKVRIEKEYVYPLLKSPTDMNQPFVDVSTINSRIFLTEKSKNELKNTDLLKYIEKGEHTELSIKKGAQKGKKLIGVNNLASFKSKNRDSWFIKNEFEKKKRTLFFQKIYNTIYKIGKSSEPIYLNNTFYGLELKNDYIKFQDFIYASLLSTLTMISIELSGRSNFGGGALDTATFDIEDVLILNPFKVDEAKQKKLIQLSQELFKRDYLPLEDEVKQMDRRNLDSHFFEILNFKDLDIFYSEFVNLVDTRVEKSKTFS
ncbi:MAG: Eco57I restriction-modification methylase domain-containing protein [Candidatus Delongbacteria bacterium]|nr:Eco57I restriction-modification methylase domain-containing protein [Candidatus Delongbacteria bacterium]